MYRRWGVGLYDPASVLQLACQPPPCLARTQLSPSTSQSSSRTQSSIASSRQTDSFFDIHRSLKLDPTNPKLTQNQLDTLRHNVQLMRDAIVLFTSTGAARGVSGHTGMLFDMRSARIYPCHSQVVHTTLSLR